MRTEYGTFRCRICGREGFAPLPAHDEVPDGQNCVELTCSRAHSDQYDIAVIQRIISEPGGKVLSKEAYAGAV